MTTVEAVRIGAPEAKYRILAQLGEGGTASVYLAVARGPGGFNKLVVLKTIKPILADDPDFRRMFLQEARVAARLNHPGVVQTYEVVETGGAPVIVMEYLDGEPLSKVLSSAQGSLSLNMHLRVIADATDALQYAHELKDFDGRPLGLVHRDITPHNVFVTFDGQTKLLDFGIAKLTTSNPETQTGVIKGKLRYMPPEQIVGEFIDRRADIYAVGVMLWEAATGEPMWKGCSDATVMNRVLNGEIVPPREVAPNVPVRLDAICMKAMASEPSDRYATAAELEAEIESLLDDLGSRTTSRSIGKVVSALFADVRERRKELIEAQLSKVALLSPEEYESLEGGIVAALPNVAHAQAPVAPTAQRKGRYVWGLAALALVGAVGLTVAATRQSSPSPAALTATPPSTVATAIAPPPKPAAPSVATVRFEASPPAAALRVDDEPAPTNPYIRIMAVDALEHTVVAEAPGYETRRETFSADHDQVLFLPLERAKGASPDKARGRPWPAPAASTVKTPSAAGPSCNPPYRIDSAGIKTFKVECL
jgi:serine/threonine-protein kinase